MNWFFSVWIPTSSHPTRANRTIWTTRGVALSLFLTRASAPTSHFSQEFTLRVLRRRKRSPRFLTPPLDKWKDRTLSSGRSSGGARNIFGLTGLGKLLRRTKVTSNLTWSGFFCLNEDALLNTDSEESSGGRRSPTGSLNSWLGFTANIFQGFGSVFVVLVYPQRLQQLFM